jgi:hypothetical protein
VPFYRAPFVEMVEDASGSADVIRQLRRYRNAMKGEAFAESMSEERKARNRNWMREAFLYLPYDEKHARFIDGVPFGNANRYYPDDTTLSQRVEQWKLTHAEEIEATEAKRKRTQAQAEIAALVAEQTKDARETRTVKARQSKELARARKMPLHW